MRYYYSYFWVDQESILRILIHFLSFLALTACSKPATVEEKVLFQFFALFVGAETYDKICNNPNILYGDMKDKKNVMWFGNMQMLTARIGNTFVIRDPQMKIEDGIKRLVDIQNAISKKTEKILKEKGCNSKEVEQLPKALKLYSEFPPYIHYEKIDEEIKKAGGTPSPIVDRKVESSPTKE